jgi:hypothetical protein
MRAYVQTAFANEALKTAMAVNEALAKRDLMAVRSLMTEDLFMVHSSLARWCRDVLICVPQTLSKEAAGFRGSREWQYQACASNPHCEMVVL